MKDIDQKSLFFLIIRRFIKLYSNFPFIYIPIILEHLKVTTLLSLTTFAKLEKSLNYLSNYRKKHNIYFKYYIFKCFILTLNYFKFTKYQYYYCSIPLKNSQKENYLNHFIKDIACLYCRKPPRAQYIAL